MVVGEHIFAISDEWERSVKKRKGFEKAQTNRMLLSQEICLGLHMTGIINLSVHYVKKTYSNLL